jgi:putative acetyltransferase
VGSALMADAIRWAREMGVEKLALSVYPDNTRAREMYQRFGFVEEGRLTGHSKKAVGYRDEILMGLWLIPAPGTMPEPPTGS